MKISVMGLGYVGTVSVACRAQEGHEAIGVDTGRLKVDLVCAHVPLLEQVGFRIVYTQPVRSDPSYERDALTRRFCTMPEDDRHISEAFLLATPSWAFPDRSGQMNDES